MKFNLHTLWRNFRSWPYGNNHIAFRIEHSGAYERYWIAFSKIPFHDNSEPIWESHPEDVFVELYNECILDLEMYFAEENVNEKQYKLVDKYHIMCTKITIREIAIRNHETIS
jgi:hypothetical protein